MMRRLRWLLLISAALGAVFCQSGNPGPVEIALNEEACSQCQMAISQRDFAAEAVFAGGHAVFFDDIGCLIRWVKDHKPEKASIFVIDCTSGEWLAGSDAHYVQSARFHSPMSYGILAYKSSAAAEGAAEENKGTLLTWEQLFAEDFS